MAENQHTEPSEEQPGELTESTPALPSKLFASLLYFDNLHAI